MDLFNELLSSVDKAISANKHLIEDPDKGLRFRITRSVGAPLTLKVKNERKMLKKRGCVKKWPYTAHRAVVRSVSSY